MNSMSEFHNAVVRYAAVLASHMDVVGGAETDEFHRQAQMYVDELNSNDRVMELYIVPNVDHFDELNVLADPHSPFLKNLGVHKLTKN